jgi:hypothetical protein
VFLNDSGIVVTGVTTSTVATIYYYVAGQAAGSFSTSALGSATAAWSSGGFYELGNGRYRVDIPNAAISNTGSFDLAYEATGYHLVLVGAQVGNIPSNLKQINGYNVTATAGFSFDAQTTAQTNVANIVSGSALVTANTTQWGGAAVTGMPMPTYTQPTGFLAATFPSTVASPTNITSASGITLAANQAVNVTHIGGNTVATTPGTITFTGNATVSTYSSTVSSPADVAAIEANAAYIADISSGGPSVLCGVANPGKLDIASIQHAAAAAQLATDAASVNANRGYIAYGVTIPPGTLPGAFVADISGSVASLSVDISLPNVARWWWPNAYFAVNAAGADAIYYTTDGSLPLPGQAGTQIANGQVRTGSYVIRLAASVGGVLSAVTTLNVT